MTGFRSADEQTTARERAPVLQVTATMVAAGVEAAREHTLGEGLDDLVLKIYLAMALESQ